nr:Aspartic peptidase [Ipomoea batatas]
MYQGNNQQREEPPKESMEDKMVRIFSELRHDVMNMRQEWKQDLRQEISTIRQEVSNLRQENNASLRHLETQVAQNSKALAKRPQGTLPSTTVNNPRERVQAVTLRSGKELSEPTLKKNTVSKNPNEEEEIPPDAPLDARNLFSSPLSSMYGSPPPSPKGLPRAEMMVPRHTLERGEPSRRPNEDTSSEEGEAPNMEVAHQGLMIEVEDLFRYRHF